MQIVDSHSLPSVVSGLTGGQHIARGLIGSAYTAVKLCRTWETQMAVTLQHYSQYRQQDTSLQECRTRLQMILVPQAHPQLKVSCFLASKAASWSIASRPAAVVRHNLCHLQI